LEWKILLQKNWLEDRLVWALNIIYELEFEKEEEGEWERDAVFEWFTGISYRVIRNWSAGNRLIFKAAYEIDITFSCKLEDFWAEQTRHKT